MKLEEEIHDTHARSFMLKSSRKNIDDVSLLLANTEKFHSISKMLFENP